MKNCKVLVGPIAGNGGIYYNEGEEIILEDATDTLFDGWKYVEILGDAEDGSVAAGRAAEPTLSESGLKDGQDLAAGDTGVYTAAPKEEEPEPEVTPTRKSRTIATTEGA